MATPRLPFAVLKKAHEVRAAHTTNRAAARVLGISDSTLRDRLRLYDVGLSREASGTPTREVLAQELANLLRESPGMTWRQYHKRTKNNRALFWNEFGTWTAFKAEALKLLKPSVPDEVAPLRLPVPDEAASNVEIYELKNEIRMLRAQLGSVNRERLTDKLVRDRIIELRDSDIAVPEWVLRPGSAADTASVPTLFVSDLHWGEVVDPAQVEGVNEFNIAIAHDRIKALASSAIDLLRNHMGKMRYPGIVIPLGGDMVAGDIHEELTATNEREIMPTVQDLWGVLVWLLETMAGEFGRVFVPCVTGNHGRNTRFIRAKGRNYTSYDWLLYGFLAKYFEAQKDARIKFLISPAADCPYQVYGHRYLLTHGDQFRGGDGMIGPLGPLTRGNKKKSARNVSIRRDYDTMLVGHFHQYMSLARLIVNGSLVGYNEYAYAGNFDFEPPQQALWLTHPQRGITISVPVQVDPKRTTENVSWVKWAA